METKDKTILVTGATGHQGGAVARHLLDRGFHVLAMTRDPAKPAAEDLADQGAEVIQGDLNDTAAITRAVKGVDGVFSVQTFLESGTEGEIRQGIDLANVAKTAGVHHFIYTSVAAADKHTGLPHFESKWTIEEHIRAIGLPYTILRPVFFMENWQNSARDPILGGTLPQPLDPNRALQMISVEDIGAFAALAFEDPEQWLGKEVELAGEELTMPQVAQIFTHILGRPVKYIQVPWDKFRAQAGDEMTRMYRWFNEHGFTADIKGLRRIHPQMLTLEQVIESENWRMRMMA